MQIEEGKFYRTRAGRKAGPVKILDPRGHYHERWSAVIEGPGEGAVRYYQDDGTWWVDYPNHDRDLVAEWQDPVVVPEITSPVRTRTVTEIVPGSYGRVVVGEVFGNAVSLALNNMNKVEPTGGGQHLSASELRAAALVLTQLADALGDAK